MDEREDNSDILVSDVQEKDIVAVIGRDDNYPNLVKQLPNKPAYSLRVNDLLIDLYSSIITRNYDTLYKLLEICPIPLMDDDTYHRLAAYCIYPAFDMNNEELSRWLMTYFTDRRRVLLSDTFPHSPLVELLNSKYISDSMIEFLYKSSGEYLGNVLITLLYFSNDYNIDLVLDRIRLLEENSINFKYECYNDAVAQFTIVMTDQKIMNNAAVHFITSHMKTPFAEVPYWVTDTVVDMHSVNLSEMSEDEIVLYYGPINLPIEVPVDLSELEMKKWGLQYRMLFNKDEWFRGYCPICHYRISKACYCARIPLPSGGWYGCYCSWDCVMLSYGFINDQMGRGLVNYHCERLIENKIQDISYY